MIRLVGTESRKLLTTKLWWGLLIVAAAVTGLFEWGTLASVGQEGNPFHSLSEPNTQRAIVSLSGNAGVFILLLGVIGITTEYRHFTSRPTFLFEPRRWRVVTAKLVTYAVFGLLYSAVCAVVVVGILVPWMNAKNVDFSLGANGIPKALLLSILGVAMYGLIGVGIGVLIRNQIAAVIGSLAYFLLLENVISIIPVVKEIYKFLPGAAAQGMVNVSTGDQDLLSPWPAGLVFLGWAILFTVLGAVFTVRRDVP